MFIIFYDVIPIMAHSHIDIEIYNLDLSHKVCVVFCECLRLLMLDKCIYLTMLRYSTLRRVSVILLVNQA